jgi:hypothetical protein
MPKIINDKSLTEIIRRWYYVLEVDQRKIFKLNRTTLADVIEHVSRHIRDECPPSVTTLRRWCLNYRDSGTLLHNRTSTRKRRLSPMAVTIMDRVIYDIFRDPRSISIQQAYMAMVCRIQEENQESPESIRVPSRTTFYNEVRKLALVERQQRVE